MFKVYNDGSIELTRGDTAYLLVGITDSEGASYEMQSGDTLTLSVKKNVTDEEMSFQKVVKGSSVFHIEPQDTQALEFGKYKYDVQLETADGDVYTVLGVNTFELLKEVTC